MMLCGWLVAGARCPEQLLEGQVCRPGAESQLLGCSRCSPVSLFAQLSRSAFGCCSEPGWAIWQAFCILGLSHESVPGMAFWDVPRTQFFLRMSPKQGQLSGRPGDGSWGDGPGTAKCTRGAVNVPRFQGVLS
jgi:hypothetical protein